MGICHDHGTSTFAHNGYFLFCISARVEKVCFTTHSPATLEALLICRDAGSFSTPTLMYDVFFKRRTLSPKSTLRIYLSY